MEYKSRIYSRREARVLSLQALCEYDSVGHDAMEVLERGFNVYEFENSFHIFAGDIVANVLENFASIDTIISELAPDWPLTQIAIVDRNILRMAIAELVWCKDKVPEKAVLNEAVELAKRFGSESSPNFVNGVLGSYMKIGITV
ncbi:MAG: N utilization substance protein B [Chloroflexi bacterium]|jgi:N utilization substance protein B|nr:MAG: N utilization substance protein B [Chloroflexota bacterium]